MASEGNRLIDADDFWQGRSVLVTGAQGFIGSWLAERLIDNGAHVVATVRDMPVMSRFAIEGLEDRCTRVWSDLQDTSELLRIIAEYEITCCFHLAAQTIVGSAKRSPHSTFETNVRGTYNLLEAFRVAGGAESIVVASSDKAYGEAETLPYEEGQPLAPTFPYDTSKACADMIARSYAETYRMPIAVTRLANVFGGGDFNFSRIVPDTVRSLLSGSAPFVRSDGSPERDFLYIEDAVSAYTSCGENAAQNGIMGRAFNFGSGNPVRVIDIVEMLIDISGADVRPELLGNGTPDGEIDRQCLDSSNANEQLGWVPRWELRDGLEATYSWYEEEFKRSRQDQSDPAEVRM